MLYKIILLFSLMTNSYAVMGPGDLALFQIASSTLSSLRELNAIVTEQREFGETFENIYRKIDNAVWKADRAVIWIEDMKALKEVDIQNLNDVNHILRQIKYAYQDIAEQVIALNKANEQAKNDSAGYKKDKKNSKARMRAYSGDIGKFSSSMTPQAAQVETAKNTKDMLAVMSNLDLKMAKQNIEIAKLTKYHRDDHNQAILKKSNDRKNLRLTKKGVLSKRDTQI